MGGLDGKGDPVDWEGITVWESRIKMGGGRGRLAILGGLGGHHPFCLSPAGSFHTRVIVVPGRSEEEGATGLVEPNSVWALGSLGGKDGDWEGRAYSGKR